MRGGAPVAVVIPAWNEAAAIGRVLDEIPASLQARAFVVVGSHDDPTAAVARAHGALVVVPARRGYGAACWTGAQAAHGAGASVIAFLDGDYADPPSALPRLLEPLIANTADLVLGCRDLSTTTNALPPHARIGNAAVRQIIRLLTGARFRDLPSYKVIRASALQRLAMREMTYGWTVEMLVKAVRADMRLAQISIPYRRRVGGQSKVAGNARASVSAGVALLTCAVTYARWRPVPESIPAVTTHVA